MNQKIIACGLLAALCLAPAPLWAGGFDAKKTWATLNQVTGTEPLSGVLKEMLDHPERAKELVKYALPVAQKDKDKVAYPAALVAGLVAADLKDAKAAELFLRICGDQAAKLHSTRKLLQSYGTLIETLYDLQDYAGSARVCKELLDLKTEDGKQRIVMRAVAVDREGGVDLVEDEGFDTTKRIRPSVYQTYIKAIAKQGKYDQALKLVDTLVQKEKHWLDLQLKGWVQKEAGKLEDAAKTYEQVLGRIRKDPDLEDDERDLYGERYRYDLSNIYTELKQIEKVEEHLNFLIKRRPEEPGFYNDLGYILADNNLKLDEAEKLIRKALELDKAKRKKSPAFDPKKDRENGAYLDSLAWVLHRKGEHKEALKYLLLAIEDKATQHIEIYDHLGDVYLALQQRDDAIRAFEDGLKHVTDTRRDQERRKEVEQKLAKLKGAK